jgi:hypothetical protein
MNSPSKTTSVGLVACSLLCSPGVFSRSDISTTRIGQTEAHKWREDLRTMSDEMRRWHKNLFHTITRAQFDEAIDRLDRQIPALARHQIIVAMAIRTSLQRVIQRSAFAPIRSKYTSLRMACTFERQLASS